MTAHHDDPFLALTDAASAEQAAAMRSAVRDRLDRVAETATWLGTLHDLADRRLPVTVRTAGDRVICGVLVGVASDHVVVQRSDGGTALIVHDALRSVRPSPGFPAPAASGDRPVPAGGTLAVALARHLEVQRDIGLVLRETREVVTGTVVGFGEDVLTLKWAGSPPAVGYVPLAAVSEVLLST